MGTVGVYAENLKSFYKQQYYYELRDVPSPRTFHRAASGAKISAGNVNENVTFPKLLSGLSFGQEACVTIKVTITGFKVSSAISRTA